MLRQKLTKVRGLNIILLLTLLSACGQTTREGHESKEPEVKEERTNNFNSDVDFLKEFTDIMVLTDGSSIGKVAVSAALQGRVMTSTANGGAGRSYGWINRELFESGDTLEQINPYGGEERFWLGPEGGQFSIFFKKGTEFNLDSWQTPRLLDLEPFAVVSQSENKAVFLKSASLENYSGTQFQFKIERTVEVLEPETAFQNLGISDPGGLQQVAYQTTNALTNTGIAAWEKESGLLSIWLLGMFNHSPYTTIVVPFVAGEESELGPVVNDTYFGKVPADRLKIGQGVIYFKGDGIYRSKIGLTPSRAKNVFGSYDYQNQILTIVQYNKPEGITDYVNSLWEIQEKPFEGDVVNSYNDGPPEPGAKPLGPFYELESSSPAAALKPTESIAHFQQTYHFEGDEASLNKITLEVLGVSVEEIQEAFKE